MGRGIRSAWRHHPWRGAHHRWAALFVALGLALGATVSIAPARAAVPASGGGGDSPSLIISSPNPPSGPAGTNLVVSGAHWHPGEVVTISIGGANGSCATTTAIPGTHTGTPDSTGAVQIIFTWPTSLGTGTYPLCGSSATIATVKTSNSFVEQSQHAPTLTLPSSAASGASVQVSGANWFPPGTQVEIRWGAAGTNGCATLLTTLTSGSDGSLSGTVQIPSFAQNTSIVVSGTSPAGTCGQTDPPPALGVTTTVAVTGTGTGGTATPGPGTGSPTPTSTATATPHPGSGTATPGPGTSTPGTGTPGAGTPTPPGGRATPTPGPGHGTPTPGPGDGNGGGSGPCPPLPSSFCSSNSTFPWWLLCLMLLGLLLLFIILLLVLISRRNQQVVTQEEDITSQIDPNSVAPMGSMRFVRAVRVTNQVVDRRTGQVISSRSRSYDEFADANGNIQRRPRT